MNKDRCAGCGQGADHDQFAAIAVDNGYGCVDVAACVGCGVCVSQCPQEAFALVRDPAKGIPLEIPELISASSDQART